MLRYSAVLLLVMRCRRTCARLGYMANKADLDGIKFDLQLECTRYETSKEDLLISLPSVCLFGRTVQRNQITNGTHYGAARAHRSMHTKSHSPHRLLV